MNVATSLLCSHPDFMIEEKADHAITCRELPHHDDDDDSHVDPDLAPPASLILPQA